PTLAELEQDIRELRGKFKSINPLSALTDVGADPAELVNVLNNAVSDVSSLLNSVGASASTSDYFTADKEAVKKAIRERLMMAFLGSTLCGDYQQTFKQFLFDDNFLLDQLMSALFDQLNRIVREALAPL